MVLLAMVAVLLLALVLLVLLALLLLAVTMVMFARSRIDLSHGGSVLTHNEMVTSPPHPD